MGNPLFKSRGNFPVLTVQAQNSRVEGVFNRSTLMFLFLIAIALIILIAINQFQM